MNVFVKDFHLGTFASGIISSPDCFPQILCLFYRWKSSFLPLFTLKIWVTWCLLFCYNHVGPISDHTEFGSVLYLECTFLVHTATLLPMTQPPHCVTASVLSPGFTNVLVCLNPVQVVWLLCPKSSVKLFQTQKRSPDPHTPSPGLPCLLEIGLLPWDMGPLSSSSSASRVPALLPPARQEHPSPLFCLYSVLTLYTPAPQHSIASYPSLPTSLNIANIKSSHICLPISSVISTCFPKSTVLKCNMW